MLGGSSVYVNLKPQITLEGQVLWLASPDTLCNFFLRLRIKHNLALTKFSCPQWAEWH